MVNASSTHILTTSIASWIPSFRRRLCCTVHCLPLAPCICQNSGTLTPLYDGPYKVVRCSKTYFRLAIGDKEDSVLVSCLEPLLASGPVVPALPRRRGCPPRLKPPPEPPVVHLGRIIHLLLYMFICFDIFEINYFFKKIECTA